MATAEEIKEFCKAKVSVIVWSSVLLCFVIFGLPSVHLYHSSMPLSQVAHFKIPRHVCFVEEFPLTTSGKVRGAAVAMAAGSQSGQSQQGGARELARFPADPNASGFRPRSRRMRVDASSTLQPRPQPRKLLGMWSFSSHLLPSAFSSHLLSCSTRSHLTGLSTTGSRGSELVQSRSERIGVGPMRAREALRSNGKWDDLVTRVVVWGLGIDMGGRGRRGWGWNSKLIIPLSLPQ